MEILLDDAILDYCFQPHERVLALDHAEASEARPVFVMPVFELCRALHFSAKEGRLSPARFRTCWDDLVLDSLQRLRDGYLFHLTQAEDEASNLPGDVLRLGSIALAEDDEEVKDARNVRDLHRSLTERFRRFHQRAVDYLMAMDPSYRCWCCEPPDYLPERDFGPFAGDQSVVLDTNIFLELLNDLPDSDGWDGTLRLSNRVRRVESAERRIRTILGSNGFGGKLLVPVSVLEEAERVASRPNHRQKYHQAMVVLQDISLRPERIPWIAFSFERLSLELFGSFLYLHEQLHARQIDAEQWPDFGDALVLANGLLNGCPVISMEWAEKHDWNAVGAIFPFLVFR